MDMMKQFAVIGLGRFGMSVAKKLVDLGVEVLAIDADEEKVQKAAAFVTHAVQADATDEDTLRTLGIRNVDCAIVSIGQDIQSSILATLLLKGLGIGYVVAKAQSELHGKVLEKLGADRVVYPERDMGIRVATNLVATNLLDYIELSPEFSIFEVVAPDEFVGKSLGELNLRAKYNVNIVAMRSADGSVTVSPGANDVIRARDVLVMIGRKEDMERLEHRK